MKNLRQPNSIRDEADLFLKVGRESGSGNRKCRAGNWNRVFSSESGGNREREISRISEKLGKFPVFGKGNFFKNW